MIKFLFSLPEKVRSWIYGAGGLIALLSLLQIFLFRRDRKTIEDYENEKALKNVKVKKDAERTSSKEKRDTDGLSDSDVSGRLRSRTNDWNSL